MRQIIGLITAVLLVGCAAQAPIRAPELKQVDELFRTCQYDQAQKLLDDFAPRANPAELAVAKTFMADLAWHAGHLERAVVLMREALAIGQLQRSAQENVRESLGKALALLGRYPESIDEYKVALVLLLKSPNGTRLLNRDSYPILAAELAEVGNVKDARALIEEARRTSPSSALQAIADALSADSTPVTGQYMKLIFGDAQIIAPSLTKMDPQPVRRVSPNYPPRAAEARITGEVVLEFTVETDGRVDQARVVRATHPGMFEEPALEAVRQWTFLPATRDCQPVATKAVQPMVFKLAD